MSMANQRLDRLKLLMKDRDFDWPSEEKLKENRLQRNLKAAETQSTVSSLTEQTNPSYKASDLSEPPLLSSSMSSYTPPIAFQSELNMPPKTQNKQSGPKAADKSIKMSAGKTAMTQRRIDDMAAVNVSFCPIIAVSKFPYRFMSSNGPANKMLVDQISQGLFAEGKFWDRAWSV